MPSVTVVKEFLSGNNLGVIKPVEQNFRECGEKLT